ncbi:cysteine synthase A [Litorimonas taeanensis]|uniref:Cysteine synthase A n=1 Tax=Litorimonas taeanensis TaxID=568099 RepID=A0A420WKH5_9PROT|nr:cysteine synthase A [Litorimonas taeanensis]RKQ71405.1 cysteine synthase A [Litorimonas taeanensis]
MIAKSVLDLIGNTPLIRLKDASEMTGCEILGKAEFLNPGQSVKDRAALSIIRHAEKSGALRPGGVVVEGTAGNTGIGLAMVCAALGYRCKIVMPRTQSQEKKDSIKLLGAELIEVDALPYSNPGNYIHTSQRLAEELAETEPNGALWANQFDNVANRQAHIDSTGPEIYEQTDGKVDGFICAIGSGGTLAGVSMALKSRNPDIQIGVADPLGSKMYSYYKNGELESHGDSVTEGIGQGRITANLSGAVVDRAYQIDDVEALQIIFELNQLEGICLGGSSGINVAGAIHMARDLGPGHTIVTVLCDYGQRYQSKIYNPDFLRSKNLPVPNWLC